MDDVEGDGAIRDVSDPDVDIALIPSNVDRSVESKLMNATEKHASNANRVSHARVAQDRRASCRERV